MLRFLQYVIGFDSVDDESKPENPMFDVDVPTPDQVQYSTVQCSAVQFNAVQFSTVQFSAFQYTALQCSTVQ